MWLTDGGKAQTNVTECNGLTDLAVLLDVVPPWDDCCCRADQAVAPAVP
jgi:hypothetical protein